MPDLDLTPTPDQPQPGSLDTVVTPPSIPVTPAATVASVQPTATPPATTGHAGYIANIESGGKADATNPLYPVNRGGPLGLHQFLASTWGDFIKARPDLFKGMSVDEAMAKRADPNYSHQAADWYAKYNEGVLTSRGVQPTAANLGLAHGFGAGGAAAILAYPDSANLGDVIRATQPKMASQILAMNPTYANMSVGQIKQRYAGMGGGAYTPMPAATAPAAPAPAVAAVTPPTAAATVQPQLAGLQRLAALQKLAMYQKLVGGTQPSTQTAANTVGRSGRGSKTAWADSIIASARAQNQNPLNTYQQLAALSGNPLYNDVG